MRYLIHVLSTLFLLTISGCGTDTENESKKDSPPEAPAVNDKSENILFSWFEDGKAVTSASLDKIPKEHREEVRVQDLSKGPGQRNPSWVFIANLTRRMENGNYEVKAIKRSDYEKKRHPVSKGPSKVEKGTENRVIMYANSHCPHCRKARNWLLENRIPYKEIDVEKNTAAARKLHEKGKRLGVLTSGVPIFEIGDKLYPGFSKETIMKAIKKKKNNPGNT